MQKINVSASVSRLKLYTFKSKASILLLRFLVAGKASSCSVPSGFSFFFRFAALEKHECAKQKPEADGA